jgi:hypothetical protein
MIADASDLAGVEVLEGVELNFDKSRFDCIYMYVRRGGSRTLLSIILWENNYVF